MTKLLILLLIFVPVYAKAEERTHVFTPIDGDLAYHLAFDQEFTAAGVPTGMCSTGWGLCAGVSIPYNSRENGCYDTARQSIPGDGYLYLSMEVAACSVDKTYPYRSGTLRTASFKVGEGYIEVRAKIPNFSGVIPNWPAIWLVGQDWPRGGEIDIFEGMGGHAFATYHNAQTPGGISFSAPMGDWTGWHVFAVLWAKDEITFYYDGIKVGKVASTQTPIVSNWMTLIINQAMGGEGGPQVPSAVMKVDYIHWYSRSPNAPTVSPQVGYGGLGDAGPAVCQ